METKTCRKCGQTKSLNDFHNDRSRPDGRFPWCKPCACADKRRDQAKHRDIRLESSRQQWIERGHIYRANKRQKYADDPERRATVAESCARYYRQNADKKKKYIADWQERNPEKKREYQRTFRARHPDASRDSVEKRRAWRKGVPVNAVNRLVVFDRDNGMCHICGLPVDPTKWDLDHVIPLSQGGPHNYDNVAVSHPKCNRGRHNKRPPII